MWRYIIWVLHVGGILLPQKPKVNRAAIMMKCRIHIFAGEILKEQDEI